MNSKKIEKSELIGLNVKVVEKNIHGKIIDETKNTFLIEAEKGRKMVLKNNNKFEFVFLDKKIVVDGKRLALRPEERIKRKVN